MSEGTETVPVAFQPGAQPGQADQNQAAASQQVQEPQNDDMNQPISRADFLKAQDELMRKVQGMVDKTASRLDKRIDTANKETDRTIEMLKKSGVKLPAEQETALRATATNEALISNQSDQQQQEPAPAQQQQQFDEAAVTNAAVNILSRQYGTVVSPEDPEAKDVKTDGTPAEFIETYTEALKKKRARMATPPQARTPGMGNTQPTNLQAQYEEEKKKFQGNVDGLYNLKTKYRKLGLKI